MRLYSFTNFYLSSIQQGIQPAHCIANMFAKYSATSAEELMLTVWASSYKTMICLNGGNAAGVRSIYEQLERIAPALRLPYDSFFEDADSLDSTMTCCGLVVPQQIYELSARLRGLSAADQDTMINLAGLPLEAGQLAQMLNLYSLAR